MEISNIVEIVVAAALVAIGLYFGGRYIQWHILRKKNSAPGPFFQWHRDTYGVSDFDEG